MSTSLTNMPCGFLRAHCYKVVLFALAGFVALEYGFGVLYEESRRLNEAYFTFNVTLPLSRSVLHYKTLNETDDYYSSVNLTAVGLQSFNSSDPFALDLLVDQTNNATGNLTKKTPMCPLVSPLLSITLIKHHACMI